MNKQILHAQIEDAQLQCTHVSHYANTEHTTKYKHISLTDGVRLEGLVQLEAVEPEEELQHNAHHQNDV